MDIPIDTTLSTERLRLRAVSMSDIDLVWSATRFAGFNDGMIWDPPTSRDEMIAVTHRNLRAWKNSEDYVFTMELKASKLPVGRVGIHREIELGKWNIGFWVHPKHWGNGYATEAVRAVLYFGFDRLNATAITTAHAVWNKRSQSVIEKLGFKFLRENPRGFLKRGQPVAEYEYELRPAL